MSNKKHQFFKKAITYFVATSTILWSTGLPFFVPVAQAANPKVNLVQYINPTTFKVRFDQAMDLSTIVAGSFVLTTGADDTETITSVSAATADGITTATVTTSGAKISPSHSDWVRVKSGSEGNAPKNSSAQANSDGNNIGIMMMPGSAVISEVKLAGATATEEFIEIYNKTANPINITNYKLTVLSQTGVATDLVTFTGADAAHMQAKTSLAAGGFRLIGPTGTSNADATYDPAGLGIANGIATDNTIILYRSDGNVEDMVGCGLAAVKEGGMTVTCPSASDSIERKASPTSTAATLATNGSEVAWGNSYDSNSNNFDFVLQVSSGVNPQSSASTAETSGGGQYQNQSPTIDHMPMSQVPSSTDATIYANMMDSETPPINLTSQLGYSTDSGATWTTLAGQYIPGSPQPFKFLIPGSVVGSGTGLAFIYYLKATDANSASTYMWSTGTSSCATVETCTTAETSAKTGAWQVAKIATTGWNNTIKGRIVIAGSDTGIDNAPVTLRGAGLTFNNISATDAFTTGAFTFSGLPPGVFRVEASAPSYMNGWLDGVPSKASGAAYTDWTLGLTAGSGGGQGGDMNSPMVTFSAPMDGMMGAPTKIDIPATGTIEAPIMIGFSKDMDSTTITADNIKIYPVSAAGLETALSGISVAYQPQGDNVSLTDRGSRSVGMTEFGPDKKAIVYSTTVLSANSPYVIDLSNSVKDTAGNALQGNKPGGGHSISFTTSGDFSAFSGAQMTTSFNNFVTGGSSGGGQFTPPYVIGSNPPNGAKNVPTNTKIIVNFSQPMNSEGINATNGAGTYVKLYDTNYNNSGSGQYVTVESIALDNNTKQFATITVGGTGLTVSHSNYAVRVLGGAKSATGVPMAMPGQETATMYQADFSTGSTSDTAAPAVLGTTLQTYAASTPCSSTVCVTGVPVNVGTIEVSFSKDMDSSTITTSNITLKSGTSTITTTINYDSLSRSVKIAPSSILYTTTTYTLTVGTGVKAMNGTALASAHTVSFTTSSDVDSTAPTVQFANADDYRLSITFSEPMQAAKATDTNNWASSVLNPTNYVLYTDDGPPPAGNTALYFSNNNLSTAIAAESGGPLTLKYDAAYSTVVIEGLRLMGGVVMGGFRIWVKNVKDLSGNIITDTSKPSSAADFGANSAGGGVMNSKDTFGMISPGGGGGGGGMSGPPSSSALSGGPMAITAFGGKDPSMMGFKPINVFPVNMLAGQESLYMIDIPVSQAIPASGQIILTFPVGFDVTNAVDADTDKLWAHKDINGPGAGTVTIASVSASSIARTVTITLGSVATQSNDFLHLEIDRIKSTTKASDGDMATGVAMGSGYQADILTKTSATGGRTLETLRSMPFFIKAAGTNTLTGTIAFKDTSNNNTNVTISNLPVFLMSPMTGPLKALVTLNATSTATYTFSNLPSGMFMLGAEPLQTISDTDYFIDLNPMPQPIEIVSGTNTKNINFQAQSNTNKPGLTVYITGTFSNEKIDLFAGGPGGFSVKTVTLNGTFTNASPSTQTFYLPGTGTFMVGMGPAMPKGSQQAGPPPMPNWMPPKPVEVNVSGSDGNWTWKDADGAADLDASAADGEITFGVSSANRTISGHVYAPTGTTGIQNAEVFAYSPMGMGGMGSHVRSGADGSFSLKVTDGNYKVGVFVPGMPPSSETGVEVKTIGDTTTVYANGVITTDVIIRVQNPSSMYTISGKVTDGTNVIKDASIYARRTDGSGNVGTKTDSMGKYILYVQPGTWQVGAFLPQYGNLTEQTVTISTASQADVDFAPATGVTFYTVKGRVCKDTNADSACSASETSASNLSNVHLDFVKTGYRNGTVAQGGTYAITVPSGTYTVSGWSPDTGKIPVKTVAVSSTIDVGGAADLPIPDTKTVTINFKDSDGNAVTLDKVYVQMDKIGTKNVSNEINRDSVSSLVLDVPAGTDYQYALDIDIPGIADSVLSVSSTADIITTYDINSDETIDMYKVKVENDATINVTVPTLYTITGTARDDSNNPLPDAIVNIKKANSDVATAIKTDSSGNYTVKLPASGAAPYLFQIDKSGYIDTGVSVVVTGNATSSVDAIKTAKTIAGQIKVGSAGVEGAKVYAKELGGGFASTETDTQGNYTLSVTAGDWKISATSDGYQEKEYQNSDNQDIVVSTTSSNQSDIDITLVTEKTGLAGLNNADITPSSGGTFEDSSASLEIIAPENAIAASQSTYQLEDKEVANVASSPTAKTIGGEGVEIMAYEPSGSSMVPKNTFNDEVTIEKKYTKAELVAEGIDTFVEADRVKMSYFDETASNWEPVMTNITYLDANEAPVIPASDLANVSYVVYAGVSDHMTVYSPTNQSPDGLAPSAPASLTGSSTVTNQISISWTAPTTNADTTTLADLLGYEVYRSTSETGTFVQVNASDVTSASYTDSSVTGGTTYYYKVTAADTGGVESAMSTVSSGIRAYAGGGGGGGGGVAIVSLPQPQEKVEQKAEEKPVEKPAEKPQVVTREALVAQIKAQIVVIQAQLIELIRQLIVLLQAKLLVR